MIHKIQSMSDIITNSSSEVFIVSTDNHEKVINFINDVCEVCGLNTDDLMHFESADRDGSVCGWSDTNYKKGDLLIHSTDENTIPYYIMEIIEELPYLNAPALNGAEVTNVKRRHLG